jgi:hypothetical protein
MARKAEVRVDRAANVLSSKFNFVTSDLACGVMLLFRRLVLSLQQRLFSENDLFNGAHASVRRSRKCVLPALFGTPGRSRSLPSAPEEITVGPKFIVFSSWMPSISRLSTAIPWLG